MLIICGVQCVIKREDLLLGGADRGSEIESGKRVELLLELGEVALRTVQLVPLRFDAAKAAPDFSSAYGLLLTEEFFVVECGDLLIDLGDLIAKFAELTAEQNDFTFEFGDSLGIVIVIHHGLAGRAGMVNGECFLFFGEFETTCFDVITLGTQICIVFLERG